MLGLFFTLSPNVHFLVVCNVRRCVLIVIFHVIAVIKYFLLSILSCRSFINSGNERKKLAQTTDILVLKITDLVLFVILKIEKVSDL